MNIGCFHLVRSFFISTLCSFHTSITYKYKYIFSLFFLAVLVFELRASHLLSKHSTTWATPPARMNFLRQGFPVKPRLALNLLCSPGWPGIYKFPASVSPGAGNTDMYHHVWLISDFSMLNLVFYNFAEIIHQL
jgi:hypothetical protein